MARVYEEKFLTLLMELMELEDKLNAELKKLRDTEVRLRPYMGLVHKRDVFFKNVNKLANEKHELKAKADRMLKIVSIKQAEESAVNLITPKTPTKPAVPSTSAMDTTGMSFTEALEMISDDELVKASQSVEKVQKRKATLENVIPAKRELRMEVDASSQDMFEENRICDTKHKPEDTTADMNDVTEEKNGEEDDGKV